MWFYMSRLSSLREGERASRLAGNIRSWDTGGEQDESIIFTQWDPGASCSPIIYPLYLITSLLNIGGSEKNKFFIYLEHQHNVIICLKLSENKLPQEKSFSKL